MMRARRLPPLILTYHGVSERRMKPNPHTLLTSRRDLLHHIAALRRWGYELVTFGVLARRARDGDAAGLAALTFDDGFANNATVLAPLVAEEEVPATVFVVSGWLGKPHPDAPSERLVNRDELISLVRAGIEIGAHTVTHKNLGEAAYEEALAELKTSKKELEGIIGQPVTVAAYPYGAASRAAVSACRDAGFEAAGRAHGLGTWTDPWDLPRQDMGPSLTTIGMRLKRADRYESLMRYLPARAVRRLARYVGELLG